MTANTGIWTPTNDYDCYGLAFDGTYLYAGLVGIGYTTKVTKINRINMTSVSSWSSPGSEGTGGAPRAVLYHDGYLYVAPYGATIAKIFKVRASDMTLQGVFTGVPGQGPVFTLVTDGTYLYAGLQLAGIILKIKLSDFSIYASYIMPNRRNIWKLKLYNGYLYAGYDFPSGVDKFNPVDMSLLGSWVSSAMILGIDCDSTYLYASHEGLTPPSYIYKLQQSNMALVATSNPYDLADFYDTVKIGSYIYVVDAGATSIESSPTKIHKLNASDLTPVVTLILNGYRYGTELVYDGRYLYVNSYVQGTYQARVLRINPNTMVLQATDPGPAIVAGVASTYIVPVTVQPSGQICSLRVVLATDSAFNNIVNVSDYSLFTSTGNIQNIPIKVTPASAGIFYVGVAGYIDQAQVAFASQGQVEVITL